MTPTAIEQFSTLSWNVNGLGSKIKRGLVAAYFKRLKPDVILLQETHLRGTQCRFLGRGAYRTLAHAGFTTGARGVAILIRKNLPFIIERTWTDPLGTYVAVQGAWNRRHITLISVYAPPKLQQRTLDAVAAILLETGSSIHIVGGDFNDVMDPATDRSRVTSGGSKDTPLKLFVDTMALNDLWRRHHPQTRAYSFYSGAHKVFSRLNYIFTPVGEMGDIQRAEYLA